MLADKVRAATSGGPNLASWSRRTPVAVTTSDIYSAVWDGTQFVAVGGSGAVVTSANGTSWTAQTSGVTIGLNGITKGGTLSLYVAVGSSGGGGGAATSPDGITWTDRSASAGSNILRSVAAAPSIVIAVGFSGAIMASTNGTGWGADTSNTTETLNSVIWSGTIFVAVGSGGTIRTRTTGNSNWAIRTSGTTGTLNGVAFSGSEYVVTRSGGFLRSTDATTWSLITFSGAWDDIVWDGTQFIARTSSNEVATSPDGTTWTGGKEIPTSQQVNFLISGNSKVLALGSLGLILETSDLINWSISSNGQNIIGQTAAYSTQLEKFVAVGIGGLLVTSDDGLTWKTARAKVSTNVALYGITWSGTQFVAVGGAGAQSNISTSPDGITWTERYASAAVSGPLQSVTWTGAQFVAVGGGANAISSDGITWTVTAGISFNAIVWVPSLSLYVAGGTATNQNLATSTNGTSWTIRIATGFSVQSIAWNGSILVAVGLGGAIRTSTNGTTWTTRTSGTAQNLYGVTWTSSGFVVVGAAGTIRTSLDGITWTGRTSGTGVILRGTTASAERAIAAGAEGTILSTT